MLAIALLGAFPTVADATIQLLDLGPGKATAINDNGAVVGQQLTLPNSGFVWNSGTRTTLAGDGTGVGNPSQEGYETASDINDSGRISGTLGPIAHPRGVFWDSPGAFTEIGYLPTHLESPQFSAGIGVDQAGNIAGRGDYSTTDGYTLRTGLLAFGGASPDFVGEASRPSGVGPHDFATSVNSINASGQMFGVAGWPEAPVPSPVGHPFVWGSPGSSGTQVNVWPTQLAGNNKPPSFTYGLVGSHEIADDGAIVGHRSVTDDNVFIRAANGTETGPIGTFEPLSINDDDSVVGYEYVNETCGSSPCKRLHAVLWEHGTLTRLDELLPADSGWKLLVAQDINKHGDIVGMGQFQSNMRAFLLRRSLIVNDTGDAPDDNLTDKTCHTAEAKCTLRAAIQETNAQSGDQVIDFSIPGGGASPTINVPAALPSADGTVEIRGETQPGGGPVRIIGNGGNFAGLNLKGENSGIHGLVIGGFGGDGVVLGGNGHHSVTASFIGTDPSGCGGKSGAACALGNGGAGVRVLAGDEQIGEETRPEGVVVSENGSYVDSDRNRIANNKGPGIAVMSGAHTQTHGNLISDNGGLPVDLGGDGLTRNDIGDADVGPNELLNAPVVFGQHSSNANIKLPGETSYHLVPSKEISYSGRGTPGALIVNRGFVDTKGCPSTYGASLRQIPSEGDTSAVEIPASGEYDLGGNYPASAESAIVVGATDRFGNSSELSNCFDDGDGDGINDSWEQKGADVDRDGKVDVPLDKMGADPKHQDIFVEFDAMLGYAFGQGSLDPVIEAFDKAPVQNLDGSQGIHLHVDMGPESLMSGPNAWDSLSQADVLSDVQGVGSEQPNGDFNWTELKQIEDRHMDPNRRPFFHYALAAPSIDLKAKGVLGISNGIPGHDFMFGLQATCPNDTPCAGPPALWPAVFMHELGHNLGLTHGGVSSTSKHGNFKPNFFSDMNYLYVPTALPVDGIPSYLDYSRVGPTAHPGPGGSVADIDELAIDEQTAFRPTGRARANEAAWICPLYKNKNAPLSVRVTPNLKGPKDFDCDGELSETTVKADLTFDRNREGKISPQYTDLEATAEWDKMNVTGGVGSFRFETVPLPPEELNDLPLSELKAIAQAKAKDRKAPGLKLKARKGAKKHTGNVTVTATDDRQISSVTVTVDRKVKRVINWKPETGKAKKKRLNCLKKAKKNRKKRAKCPKPPSPKRLTTSLTIKGKGKHKVSAVVYDTALRAKARQLKLKIK